ncbi:unnamed protein product [Trichogramma brassicae]|uniref:Uncharacterized protein n=1 Tax=Trichogramma brassicae TaxID=86971 RepID=A0A6H5ICK9_9HYME|nr:unnamed protein product [Trichogramma brassicae]
MDMMVLRWTRNQVNREQERTDRKMLLSGHGANGSNSNNCEGDTTDEEKSTSENEIYTAIREEMAASHTPDGAETQESTENRSSQEGKSSEALEVVEAITEQNAGSQPQEAIPSTSDPDTYLGLHAWTPPKFVLDPVPKQILQWPPVSVLIMRVFFMRRVPEISELQYKVKKVTEYKITPECIQMGLVPLEPYLTNIDSVKSLKIPITEDESVRAEAYLKTLRAYREKTSTTTLIKRRKPQNPIIKEDVILPEIMIKSTKSKKSTTSTKSTKSTASIKSTKSTTTTLDDSSASTSDMHVDDDKIEYQLFFPCTTTKEKRNRTRSERQAYRSKSTRPGRNRARCYIGGRRSEHYGRKRHGADPSSDARESSETRSKSSTSYEERSSGFFTASTILASTYTVPQSEQTSIPVEPIVEHIEKTNPCSTSAQISLVEAEPFPEDVEKSSINEFSNSTPEFIDERPSTSSVTNNGFEFKPYDNMRIYVTPKPKQVEHKRQSFTQKLAVVELKPQS